MDINEIINRRAAALPRLVPQGAANRMDADDMYGCGACGAWFDSPLEYDGGSSYCPECCPDLYGAALVRAVGV